MYNPVENRSAIGTNHLLWSLAQALCCMFYAATLALCFCVLSAYVQFTHITTLRTYVCTVCMSIRILVITVFVKSASN